jgi:bifunctional non-homologous end joining protein LigD
MPKIKDKPVMPGFIEPQLLTLVERSPAGSGWLHEIKFDGYRTQLRAERGKAKAQTRRGNDWSNRFAGIVAAARALLDCIMDGEAAVLDSDWHSDFSALQSALADGHDQGVTYFAFDLLFEDGKDLRKLALFQRKARLQAMLQKAGAKLRSRIEYVTHIEGDGPEVQANGCEMGLEGIVSKRRTAPYRSVRSDDWQKVKCSLRETFTIGGWRERAGLVSSVMAGEWRNGAFHYAGKARVNPTQHYVRDKLKAVEIDAPPFARTARPEREERQHWAQPVLQAELSFRERTKSNHIRHGMFLGLREDGPPAPATAAQKPRSRHVQRLLPDALVPSPDELRAYWRKVGGKALKYLARRPLTLVRHDHGQTFFHTGPPPATPKAVQRLTIAKREGGEGTRLWVDSVAGLVALADIGIIELHPWNATVDNLEHPDQMVFDLDPGDGIEWGFVTDTALALRDFLKSEEGLSSWPKATGGKGLHLMVPLDGSRTHDQARAYANEIAGRFAKRDSRYTVVSNPRLRPSRVFIDYLRNGRGQTAIGAYSPRARPGFPIAMPLTWKQVEKGVRSDALPMSGR